MVRYHNPIIPGFYPDPSICKKGDDYYLVTSSFEFFPGVPIFHSRDLVNWKQIGHCLTRKSQLDLDGIAASKGIYAPTIRYHDGMFYMVTTNTTKLGNFYVTATDPAGEWSEPIKVEQGGIDPSLFWDDDDTCYFISNARERSDLGFFEGAPAQPFTSDEVPSGFLMGPINTKTGEFLAEPRPVWGGTGGQAPEAPHIYKKDGWYYQMIAEGGTELGHMITIARSRELFGPYEACPNNPILTHKNLKRRLIQATGHGDLIEDNYGNWWVVFLGFRQTAQYFHHLGRETFLAPVEWVDGWPVINDNCEIKSIMQVDGRPETIQMPRPSFNTNFENGLPLSWVYLRNPEEANYSFKDGLNLLGSAYNLSDVANPTFAAQRQMDLTCNASVDLKFNPVTENEEAGFSVFYKFDAHYEIVLTNRNEKRVVMLRKVVGDIFHIEGICEVQADVVTLCIKSDHKQYVFSVCDGESVYKLGSGLTRHVSTEAHVLGFTGVMLALYATGNGRAAQNWAKFSNFCYEGLDREE